MDGVTTNAAAGTIKISVNGEIKTTSANTLAELIGELDFAGVRVATALNGEFIPATAREACAISAGDKIEVVSARQGG